MFTIIDTLCLFDRSVIKPHDNVSMGFFTWTDGDWGTRRVKSHKWAGRIKANTPDTFDRLFVTLQSGNNFLEIRNTSVITTS